MLCGKFSPHRVDSTGGERGAEFGKLIFADIALEVDRAPFEWIRGSSYESPDLCFRDRIERRIAATEEEIFVAGACVLQPDADIAGRHCGLMWLNHDAGALVVETFQSRLIEHTCRNTRYRFAGLKRGDTRLRVSIEHSSDTVTIRSASSH